MSEQIPKYKNVVSKHDLIVSKVQAFELSLEEIKSSQDELGTTLMDKMNSLGAPDALEIIGQEQSKMKKSSTSGLITALIFLACSLAISATIYALFMIQKMESSWQKRIQQQIDEAVTLEQVIRALKEEKRDARSNN